MHDIGLRVSIQTQTHDEMSIERQKEDKTASKSNKTNYLWDE